MINHLTNFWSSSRLYRFRIKAHRLSAASPLVRSHILDVLHSGWAGSKWCKVKNPTFISGSTSRTYRVLVWT